MKCHLFIYSEISLLTLLYCFLPIFTKNYEIPASSNSIENNRIDTIETIQHEQYPDPKTKFNIDVKENLFSKAEVKSKLSEDVEKEVSHPSEMLLTTAEPEITFRPHGIIFPGTKWCGPGNISKSEDDLGALKKTDNCCRIHDHCPDSILPGETKNNLTNDSEYTRMSCDCDRAFYNCLKEANTFDASMAINIYFNILKLKCFELDYPRNCKHYKSILKLCDEFELDTSAEKIYQWIILKYNG